ncbi:hypothetical protein CP967_18070 [Streptomyces nitrosporeus]|uniref:Uncharacterized protein n=1 Tax=Streptomyces nitrosporeus TaxID=28894 RepID=A0A5J6FDR5_9ACTN|nr:hypothetical protein [Streptomyces nitrosporeus]QEU73644.1 hypothetical protein CP967_18070 [Streptomyces nitrosporeus]
MSRSRHRRPATPAHALVRADRSSRFALTFLALAGLAGPAWALRSQADQLLGSPARRAAVAMPEAFPLPRTTDR